MKRKILSIFLTLVLVCSFSLVTAVPVAANGAILEVNGPPVQLATGALNLGSFSPDGSKIVYGGAGIWVMNADGSEPHGIYSGARPNWGLPIDGYPDGLIAIGGTGITIITPDGTLVKTIDTSHLVYTEATITATHSLDWSPDGTKLAFSDSWAGTAGIWTVDYATGDLTQITDYTKTAYSPTWSPDGTEIACAWGPSSDMYVGVFSSAGASGGSAPLRTIGIGGSYGGDYPDWGANGKIAYHDSTKALHVMNANGNDDTVVFAGPAAMVAWSPDGQTLAYNDATSGLFGNVWTRGYPYATIQAAVTDANPGDTIIVADGAYIENVTINKTLTLLSTSGRANTTIQGDIALGGELGTVFVTNNTDGVQIGDIGQGFTIIGIDGTPGLEKAAVYFQGNHSNAVIKGNDIVANGDAGLLTEWGATITGFVISDNEFSGQTFIGTPGGEGFDAQFTEPNVPRQLANMGGGSGGGSTSAITFTENHITGTAGGINSENNPQGNTLVTIDSVGSTITGNVFEGTTTRYGTSLRARGPNAVITGNDFRSTGLTPSNGHLYLENNPIDSALIAANTFDKGVYVESASGGTIGLSIQGFVSAVPEDTTINVLAGTYIEKLTITKPLLLVGKGLIRPVVDIPDGDDAGVTITASDVTVENIYFYRQDRDGWSNCIINIPRGGSWGAYTIEYERITFRNVLFEGAARGAFITAGDLTIEGCEFKGQLDDALYFDAVSGTTLISGNRFEGDTESTVASRKAILFENFDDSDPANSGTIRIESNVVDGTTNLLVYNQWIQRDGVGPVDIRVVGNSILDLESFEGWDDIGSAVVIFDARWLGGAGPDFSKVGSVVVQMNDFSGVPENRWGVLGPPEVGVDATLNWWGSVNGPEHAGNTFNVGFQGAKVSDQVDYVPWLDASGGEPFAPVRTTDPEGGFASIQAGVTASNAAGTVSVAAGTYTENLNIPVGKDNLRLLGAGVPDTILSPASGTAISVSSPVIIKGFYILQSDSSTGIQMMGAGASGTSENPGIIDANKLESPSASRGNGIDFKDYDINYWVIKDNELINRKLAIYLNRASHLVIIGNTLTGYKEGIGMNWDGEPAHDLTIVGNKFLGTDYPFTEQELLEKAAIMLGEVSYDVLIAGNTITDSPSGIRIPDHAEGVTNLSNVHINVNDIYNNANYGIINDVSVEVDATYNWWGSVNGPGQDEANGVLGDVDYSPWLPGEWEDYFDDEGNPIHSDNDGFSDLDEYWLGTDPDDDTDFPGATIDPGQVDTAYVAGDDPSEVNLQDSEGGTIANVDISGGGDGSGTITGARYTDALEPIETTLSVGTGTSGVVFLDVRVTGYTEGIAHISVPYPDEELEPEGGDGIVDETDIDENTLGLYYWDEAADPDPMWRLADNNEVDTALNTVSGDIPVSALTGTPVGMGGYLEDEAAVAIESILNLNYSVEGAPGGTVTLTIDTNTAFLGAATIDLIFDPRVVEVVAGENSVFDTLTVNPDYAHFGDDTQIARFVANQAFEAGVNATGGVVVAEVKLNAVGSTMDESPLTLEVITLKDNKGDTIPLTLGANDSIAIVGGIGDADRSGKVDAFDCVYIARAIAGFPGWSIDTPTMDVSGDDMVDAWDCTYLARHLVGILGYPLGG
ncbi:MAG TPA: right-handed parallel beta-helix repeat-containing protein [Dehalococcoidales bacterium]|nr:right-handed parallel beta-helix repeat-containing protein [Dehalococcoidales bacterium]